MHCRIAAWLAWMVTLPAAGCSGGDAQPADTGGEDASADDGSPEDGDVPPDSACPPPNVVCFGRCVDPLTDNENCGDCGIPCAPPYGTGTCTGGRCLLVCDAGWVDVNGLAWDGCEYECTISAPSEERGGPSCANGLDDDCDGRTDLADPDCADCVPEFCDGDDDDCDGLTDEDYDLDFDALHCGACGHGCPARPHAAPACALGACDLACAPGWRDEDGVAANGCEAACAAGEADETACDGVDDDCDGTTDEQFAPAESCGAGLCVRPEVCVRGVVSCRPRTPPSPSDTTCDGLDDDCDGSVDDEADCSCATPADCDDANPCTTDECGTDLRCRIAALADGAACPGGTCCARACVGTDAEVCNGRDDDCDGTVDEGFACPAGEPVACTTSCGSAGIGMCSAACLPPAGALCPAPAEACNGADDDCDGACDDGFDCCAGAAEACTTGTGAAGVRNCGGDCSLGPCLASSDPCNGADDNGDTACDEGFACCAGASESRACTCGGSESRSCDGACNWGGWSGCPGGDCSPGSSEDCTTGCGLTGSRTCRSDCSWGRCDPPATAYRCPTSGAVYADAGSCGARCTETASCDCSTSSEYFRVPSGYNGSCECAPGDPADCECMSLCFSGSCPCASSTSVASPPSGSYWIGDGCESYTEGATYYQRDTESCSCPLGGFGCSGSPSTCTAGRSCDAIAGC